MSTACPYSQQALVERFLDGRVNDDSHFTTCASCIARLATLEKEMAVVRTSQPPPRSDALRQRDVLQAIAQVDHSRASEGERFRRRFFQFALSGALVAAVAVIALVLWPRAISSQDHFTSGSVAVNGKVLPRGEKVPPGALFEARDDARLELFDGSEVAVASGTKAKIERAGERIWLESGRVTLSVRPRHERPLVIATPEAIVTVVGTRFTVERTGTRTSVEVSEGIVEVTMGAQLQRLTAGAAWSSTPATPEPSATEKPSEGQPPTGTATEPGPNDTNADEANRPDTQRPTPRRHAPKGDSHSRAAEIRARLDAGRVAEARALLSARGGSSVDEDQAELAILEAETRLREGQSKRALSGYLEVVDRFPKSPQAEEALFAAGQLAVDFKTKPQVIELLERYVTRYPHGNFEAEARALLTRLQNSP